MSRTLALLTSLFGTIIIKIKKVDYLIKYYYLLLQILFYNITFCINLLSNPSAVTASPVIGCDM